MRSPHDPHTNRVLIVGAGAVGTVLASSLEGRATILVADTCPNVRAAYRHRGIRALDPARDLHHFPFHPDDIIILATRAPAALAAVAPLPADHPIISVANGFNAPLDDARPDRIIPGVVNFSAFTTTPGHADRPIPGGLTLPRHTPRDVAARLAAAVDRSIVRAHLTDDIDGHRWSKLLINASLEPVAAITDGTYGTVFSHPASFAASCSLLREGVRVAHAAGFRLHPVHGCTPSMLARIFACPLVGALAAYCAGRKARAVKSTMLHDLRRGARTEMAHLNAHIVAVADRLGVPAPANRRAVELLGELESGRRRPHRSLAKLLIVADEPPPPRRLALPPIFPGRRAQPRTRPAARTPAPCSPARTRSAST